MINTGDLWFFFVVAGWLGLIMYVSTNQVQLVSLSNFERLDSTFTGVNSFFREYIQKIALPFLVSAFLFSSALRARLLSSTCSSYNFVIYKNKVSKLLLVIAIFSAAGLLFYDIFSLKRIQTINMAASLVAAYYIVTPPLRITFFRAIAYLLISSMVIYTISWVTSSREIYIGGSFYHSWLLYFAGPLSYFDEFVMRGSVDNHYYGLSSLMGLIGYTLTPLAAVFGMPDVFLFYFERQAPFTVTSDGILYNAFGTMMLDGYYDLGLAGVFILSCIAGLLTTLWYNKGERSSYPFSVCLSSIAIVWVMFLPLGWTGGLQFAFGQAPISLIIIYFWRQIILDIFQIN
jgi:oligosaccharide repeat unit polymerase